MSQLKRHFILNKEIRTESVEEIIKGIIDVNKYDGLHEIGRTDYHRAPIEIVVDTVGGSCYTGFSLMAVMDTSITPVHTYCYGGKAMSMGIPIFSAGHKRFAHPLTTFMYHQVSGGTGGKLGDMEISVEEAKRINQVCIDWILETSNIPKAKLLDSVEKKYDWFFTAQEAFDYGLVDVLLPLRNRNKK